MKKSKVIKVIFMLIVPLISVASIGIASYDNVNSHMRFNNAQAINNNSIDYKKFYSNRQDIYSINFSKQDTKNEISSLKTITDLFGDDITINSYNDKLNAFKVDKTNSVSTLNNVRWNARYLIEKENEFQNEAPQYSGDILRMCHFIFSLDFGNFASLNDKAWIASLAAGILSFICSGAIAGGFERYSIESLILWVSGVI